jgi:hypothetical protein
MSIVGTPDYQEGVVSAQVPLATVPAATSSVLVGVPPNANTIAVLLQSTSQTLLVQANGTNTGALYQATRVLTPGLANYWQLWWIDVTAVLDTQLEIIGVTPVTASWFVYGDTAARLTADVSGYRTIQGIPYMVPTVPGTTTRDHPPNEVSAAGATFTSNGILVAAPGGAGQRLRIFSIEIGTISGTAWGSVAPVGGAYNLAISGPSMNGRPNIPAQGVPLAANTALGFFLDGGSGQMFAQAYYVQETV